MLPKKNKIKRKEFLNVALKGKMFHSPHLTLRVAKDVIAKNNPPRVSFIISGKVVRKATDRNRVKRRGYAVARKNFKILKPNYLYAFFFKKGSPALSFEELKKEIVFLIEKAGAF